MSLLPSIAIVTGSTRPGRHAQVVAWATALRPLRERRSGVAAVAAAG